MSVPARPTFQKEGPASPCTLHGKNLSWMNCTPLSTAMGVDRSTLGRVRISGCQVRDEIEPPDYVGGTTLKQCSAVAEKHGVDVEVHVGANVCTPRYAAIQLQAGRGFVLQGNTQPDGRGNVNHAYWVNHAGKGSLGAPTSAMVYDPWSNGPEVWSWSDILAFAAALRVNGEDRPEKLGPGKFYCAIYPDTEPHAHFKHGGVKTNPFPDKTLGHSLVAGKRVRVRTGPGLEFPPVPGRTLKTGDLFLVYQAASSKKPLAGSKVWYGNHDGTEWVHKSGLTAIGGSS